MFRKLHKWTEKEVEILKKHFHDMPFSSHSGSRFDYLYNKLKEYGIDVTNITPKSISRKTQRLGLKSYAWSDELVDTKCHICKKKVQAYSRYSHKALCDKCRKEQKYEWSKTEEGKEYNSLWHKNNKK